MEEEAGVGGEVGGASGEAGEVEDEETEGHEGGAAHVTFVVERGFDFLRMELNFPIDGGVE